MKLIVGLGNPGKKYETTKHNVGFMVIDQLIDRYGESSVKEKYKCFVAEGKIRGEKVLLVKPQTFMNLCGEGVAPLASYFKVSPKDIIVIYDDLDMPVGQLRVRAKGGSGGHNGIKSLIQMLGTQEFPRIKIGIGRPPQGWQTADYVLSTFTSDEWPQIQEALEKSAQAVEVLLTQGIIKAMNDYN